MGFFSFGKKKGDSGPKCLCCGTCCEAFGGHLNATKRDMRRWKEEGREDILANVNRLGWLWANPETGKLFTRCPYLYRNEEEKVVCGIHDTKPDMCRDYPTLAHERRCAMGITFN